jgi:hypothetical protein
LLHLCTKKCVQSVRKTLAFVGALDGRKTITYATLIEEYSTVAVNLQDALTEVLENQGVVDPATLSDVELVRETVQNRLISNDMVQITQFSRQVKKAHTELRSKQHLNRHNGVTVASAYMHCGSVHDTHAFEYLWICRDEQWSPSEKTSTITDLLLKETELDVIQWVKKGDTGLPLQPSLSVATFLSSVPSFITSGSGATATRLSVGEEMLVDDTELSTPHRRAEGGNHLGRLIRERRDLQRVQQRDAGDLPRDVNRVAA